MSLAMARGLVSHLIAFAVLLQAFELRQMLKSKALLKIWSHDNLASEMPHSLAKDGSLRALAWAEIGLGAIAFLHPGALVFLFLFLTHLLICIRFRGSVNGGSDSMTATILLGCFFAFLFKKEGLAGLGLVWIAVHLLLSYLRAGLSKWRQPEWRNGTAVPLFFEQSFFADIRLYGKRLLEKPLLAKLICWFVIVAEVGLVLSPFVPPSAMMGLLLFVTIFHFTIYWTFGLNRFFWAWLAAWPSIFYLGTLIRH